MVAKFIANSLILLYYIPNANRKFSEGNIPFTIPKKKTDKKTKLGTKKFKVYVKETLELF